jgi:hypothetical protein
MPEKEDVDEILVNSRFKMDITGLASSSDVVRVEVDDVTIETQDVTSSADTQWRKHKSGMPLFGHLRVYFRVADDKLNKDIFEWQKATAAGAKDKIRKTATLTLLKRDGTAGRTYNFHDLVCVSLDDGTYSTDAETNLSCLTMQIGRIDLQ